MADLDQLISKLRAVAASRGTAWLQAQVASLMGEQDSGSPSGRKKLQGDWRSQPPEHFSPDSFHGAQRQLRRPNRDHPSPSKKLLLALVGGKPGRNPQCQQSLAGGERGATLSSPSARGLCQEHAAAATASADVAGRQAGSSTWGSCCGGCQPVS